MTCDVVAPRDCWTRECPPSQLPGYSATKAGKLPAGIMPLETSRKTPDYCENCWGKTMCTHLKVGTHGISNRRKSSTPGRIRTCNPRFRRPMRYPVAPRARKRPGYGPRLWIMANHATPRQRAITDHPATAARPENGPLCCEHSPSEAIIRKVFLRPVRISHSYVELLR